MLTGYTLLGEPSHCTSPALRDLSAVLGRGLKNNTITTTIVIHDDGSGVADAASGGAEDGDTAEGQDEDDPVDTTVQLH